MRCAKQRVGRGRGERLLEPLHHKGTKDTKKGTKKLLLRIRKFRVAPFQFECVLCAFVVKVVKRPMQLGAT